MKLIKDLPNMNFSKRGLYLCQSCKKTYERYKHGQNPDSNCAQCFKKADTGGNRIHKMSDTKIYNVWKDMKYRCKKSHKRSKDYFHRGITVYKEWDDNFLPFYNWAIKNGYMEGLTIDRKNNDEGYNPGNCRWVNLNIQARNTRKIRVNNTSGYRGVHKIGKKWRAQIRVNNQGMHLGMFHYPYTAAIAYDSYVINNCLEHTTNFKRKTS